MVAYKVLYSKSCDHKTLEEKIATAFPVPLAMIVTDEKDSLFVPPYRKESLASELDFRYLLTRYDSDIDTRFITHFIDGLELDMIERNLNTSEDLDDYFSFFVNGIFAVKEIW